MDYIDRHKVKHPTDTNKYIVDERGDYWYLDPLNGQYYGYIISMGLPAMPASKPTHGSRIYIDETTTDKSIQQLLTWLRSNLIMDKYRPLQHLTADQIEMLQRNIPGTMAPLDALVVLYRLYVTTWVELKFSREFDTKQILNAINSVNNAIVNTKG